MENEFSNEYIKHHFTEDEKREIAIEMAEKVTQLKKAEDDLKAVKSEFKSKIDGFQANVNFAAPQLTNGYEMRTIECERVPEWDRKVWLYTAVDTGVVVKESDMTADDLQMQF